MIVRHGDEAVDGSAAIRQVAAYGGSRRERNDALRIGWRRQAQEGVIFRRAGCKSDRSDGQRNRVHQQYPDRSGVVSAGIPNRDLSLTAAPPGGRFFFVKSAGVNAWWQPVGAAANRLQSAD